jgi:hypothetical protein
MRYNSNYLMYTSYVVHKTNRAKLYESFMLNLKFVQKFLYGEFAIF